MEYRGRDDTIIGRVVDRAIDKAKATRGAEAEYSHIRVGRVTSTDSH